MRKVHAEDTRGSFGQFQPEATRGSFGQENTQALLEFNQSHKYSKC